MYTLFHCHSQNMFIRSNDSLLLADLFNCSRPVFSITINTCIYFDVLLTVHLSIFISVINQLDAQHFCFTISLFHASTCFEHMCSKHLEAWNKLIVKQKFCTSSLLITEIKMRILFLLFAIPQCLTHVKIYNDVSVKHNTTLLCVLLY